jgi:hypothetical protein
MKFQISKEWCEASARKEVGMSVEAGNPALVVDHMFGLWFEQLKKLAESRGLSWLVGEPQSHRPAFDEGLTTQDELDHQIAEATRDA